MNSFKTPKGTVLPILNLRGKDYLEVKYRLIWFREEHPDWGIETDLIAIAATSATAKSIVKDTSGRVIAMAHKTEDQKGFPDFMEKAETGAIGRALALIGYGTQFAEELEEGERIVDSPVSPKGGIYPSQPEPGDGVQTETRYMIDFGQWNKRSIEQVYQDSGPEKIASYIDFLEKGSVKSGKPLSDKAVRFIAEASNYLGAMENAPLEQA